MTGEEAIPGVTGEDDIPGVTGEDDIPGVTGEEAIPGVTGEDDIPGVTGEDDIPRDNPSLTPPCTFTGTPSSLTHTSSPHHPSPGRLDELHTSRHVQGQVSPVPAGWYFVDRLSACVMVISWVNVMVNCLGYGLSCSCNHKQDRCDVIEISKTNA